MARRYSLTFQLFDVTQGEKSGDIIDQTTTPEIVSPLKESCAAWSRYCAQSPVVIPPPNEKAIRVALTRNGGAAIMRRRFDYQGAKYLVQMRVEVLVEVWRGRTASGDMIELLQNPARPLLLVSGERVELSRAE